MARKLKVEIKKPTQEKWGWGGHPQQSEKTKEKMKPEIGNKEKCSEKGQKTEKLAKIFGETLSEKIEKEKINKLKQEKIEKRNIVRDRVKELERNRKEKLVTEKAKREIDGVTKGGEREKVDKKKEIAMEKTRKLSIRREKETVKEKIETVSNKYKSEEKYEKKVASTSVSKFKIENFKVGEKVKFNISTYRQGYGNVI